MRPSQKQITPEQLAFAQVHALVRIVDDEADLREALSFVLDMEGWKTVTYGRAEDFFTGDSPSEPGCVVLDVRMPGMSGIEAQHEMRSRGIALPIIFLTGHGDVDMAVGAVQDGAFRSGIAQRTMEVHRANILRKLGVKTPEDIRRLLEMAAAEKS